MKDTLYELKEEFPQYDKDERADAIYHAAPIISAWYIEKGHRERETLEDIIKIFSSRKASKATVRVSKEQENGYGFPIEFVLVLREVINRLSRSEENEDMVAHYSVACQRILKSQVKKFRRAADIGEAAALELLSVVPSTSVIRNERVVGIFVGRVVRKLYQIIDADIIEVKSFKHLRSIFRFLFGEEYETEVAISLLLERRLNDNMGDKVVKAYGQLTDYALDTIMKLDKAEITGVLENYARRRENDYKRKKDAPRRFNPKGLSNEDYKKLHKAIKKLIKQDERFKVFF